MAIAFAMQVETRIWIVRESGEAATLTVPHPEHATLIGYTQSLVAVRWGKHIVRTYNEKGDHVKSLGLG